MTTLAPEQVDWRDVEPSQENADKLFPAQDIGPTWLTDDDGDWLLPQYTLGWEVIAWAEEHLNSPMGDGSPLNITLEQMRIILWHYAIDEDGNWSYWKCLWQSAKGAGKDGLGAILGLVELIGPCRFSHWEYTDDGEKVPVAKSNPAALVQFAGVSKEQTNNTMDFIPMLLPESTKEKYNLEVQKEIVYVTGTGRKLQQVGANWPALQGKRATYVVMNEMQHWYSSQGGPQLYDVLKNNVLKTRGHFLVITNAYQPGEDSMHERIRLEQEKVWRGLAQPSGWLYMSREAHPEAPLHPDWVEYILRPIYGDAYWQTRDMSTVATEVLDGSTPPSQIRRMFYNQIVASEDAFFSPAEIARARRENCYGDKNDLSLGDEIVMGFDGGKTDDATALVAIRIKDKLIVPLAIWQKPDGPLGESWRIDENEVNETVIAAFQDYTVRAFYADPALWQSWISQWNEAYREELAVRASAHSSIAWEMSSSNQRIGRAWESFYDAIRTRRLQHNGDKLLESHMTNARRGRGKGGLIARKENPESPLKIDSMVAAYVAYAALEDYLQKGKKPKQYRRQMMRA
jgi:hypothetical protein